MCALLGPELLKGSSIHLSNHPIVSLVVFTDVSGRHAIPVIRNDDGIRGQRLVQRDFHSGRIGIPDVRDKLGDRRLRRVLLLTKCFDDVCVELEPSQDRFSISSVWPKMAQRFTRSAQELWHRMGLTSS